MLEDNVDMRKDLNFLHASKEEERLKAAEAAAKAKTTKRQSILKTPRSSDIASGESVVDGARPTPPPRPAPPQSNPPRPDPPKGRPRSTNIKKADEGHKWASGYSKTQPTISPRPKPQPVVKVKKVSGHEKYL